MMDEGEHVVGVANARNVFDALSPPSVYRREHGTVCRRTLL
jgi:hypothetical protein